MNKFWRSAAILLLMGAAGCDIRSLPGNIDAPTTPPTTPPTEPPSVQACAPGMLCAGAAKTSISPSTEQVAGVEEDRFPGTHVIQKFHLGGFGFGPFEASKFLATYSGGALDERTCFGETCLSEPPAIRPFHCKGFVECTADSPQAERTWTRAFYLSQPDESGAGQQMLFVTLDAVGAGNIVLGKIKTAVAEATGVPEEDILVGMTHSHAGADLQGLWGGVPQDWIDNVLVKGAAAAAAEAKANARAATLSYARGHDAAWNNYRRPRVYPESETDTTLSILQAKDTAGQVLGTIVQYAAHPTAVGDDAGGEFGRAVHPDYVLGLEDTIEEATGATTVYYNGPIADASGSGPTEGDDDYQRVHSRGACIARSAMALLSPVTTPCEASELVREDIFGTNLSPTLELRHVDVILPVTNPLFLAIGLTESFNRYYNFNPIPVADIPVIGGQADNLPQLAPTAMSVVSRVTIGGAESGLEIVTIPGEATNTFGQYIRGLTPNTNMMLLGLTHNSYGYIIPEEEFNYVDLSGDTGFVLPLTGYEEFVSLGPLTAPLLRLQAYNPLFDLPLSDVRNLPPSVTACVDDPAGRACILSRLIGQVDYVQRAYAQKCRENLPESAAAFCDLVDPQTPLYGSCIEAGLPESVCVIVGGPEPAGG